MSFTISLVSQGRHHVVCFFFLVGLFETKFPSTSVFMENSATMFFAVKLRNSFLATVKPHPTFNRHGVCGNNEFHFG